MVYVIPSILMVLCYFLVFLKSGLPALTHRELLATARRTTIRAKLRGTQSHQDTVCCHAWFYTMLGADTSYWPDSRKNNENSSSRVSNGLFYTYLPVVGHKPDYILGHES